MEQRELGMVELHKRLKVLYNELSLKEVMRVPDREVDGDDIPCILIIEGEDEIVKTSSSTSIGYPCRRSLQVIVECWDHKTGNVKNIYQKVRAKALVNNGVLVKGVILKEAKAAGPFNLGIPKVEGMRCIFGLEYLDSGPTF